jgi:protein gp37
MGELQSATPDAARRLTDRIKVAVEGTWLLIEEAYLTRAWTALGYGSWDDYCKREFGTSRLRLPSENRPEVVTSLRQAGLSLRAIASATAVDEKTVRNDLATAESGRQNSAVETERNQSQRSGTGIDGKTRVYPPRAAPVPSPPSPKPKPQPVMLQLRTHDGRTVPYPKPQAKATFNETTGEGISWAAWSWNPVTGCLHGCDYCYARAIANRWSESYPAGFTPLFHEERLSAPANTTIPGAKRDDPAYRRVFVCSMADLYGRWVPDEWIRQVHKSMLDTPAWEYLLLTKFPARYVGLDLPPGAWVGTSVDEQKRVRIAENAFRQIEGVKVKWLSLEPLREPLKFTDLSMFDWVVIGAQTKTEQPDGIVPAFAPPFEWVARLAIQALDAGCKVHLKPNLRSQPGMEWLNQYPGTEGSA